MSGLLCALECTRHGLVPTVLESRGAIQAAGDFITIGPTVMRAFEKWPKLLKAFNEAKYDLRAFYHKHTGELAAGPMPLHPNIGKNISRAEFHRVLMEAVRAEGIDVRCDHKVVRYLETADKGGVELANGEMMWADLVVAADGIHSKSWKLVSGKEPEVYSSGSAIFRAAFPVELVMENANFRKKWAADSNGDKMAFYIGSTSHGIMVISSDTASWVWMHKDNPEASSESWAATLSPEAALSEVDQEGDWAADFRALIAATPPKHIVDWQLLWRDLNEKWTSPRGRVVQIGDAVHAFLPTSFNGGTQAMEDAVSLAACVRLAINRVSVGAISEGVRVHNMLRLDRVSCIQQRGVQRRQAYRNMDWEAVARDPRNVYNPPENWQVKHAPEEYARERFDECLECMRTGKEFRNTNVPEGFKHYPWKIKDLIGGSER